MKFKIIIQTLIIIFCIFLVIYFYKFFENNKKKDLSSNLNIQTKIEKKENEILEGIKYTSIDTNQNEYLIKAKNGSPDEERPNTINLNSVTAKLTFDNYKIVNVFADKAIYNTENNDTKFLDNVRLIYNFHEVVCDEITIKFSENYALLKDNLIYKNLETKIIADEILIDLLNRSSKIFMKQKSKKVILTTKNVSN